MPDMPESLAAEPLYDAVSLGIMWDRLVSLTDVTLLPPPLADRLSPFAPESPQARSNGDRTRSHFGRVRIM